MGIAELGYRRTIAERVDLDLADASGTFQAEWFNTNTGFFSQAEDIRGGNRITLKSPFVKGAVLLLKRSN
jgi:hypothetical protein